MISTTPARHRRRSVAAVAALACGLAAGTITPLLGGTAAAALLPAPPVVGPAPASSALKEVVLDWAPVAGAQSYVAQVGVDEQWAGEPTLELTTVASRVTLPTWLPHASYVWRVAAVGKDGQGAWSTVGSFDRGWADAPVPLSPTGAAPVPSAGVVSFRWTPVPTASEYQLQVSDQPFVDSRLRRQGDVKTESCFTTRTSVTPFNSQASARNDGAGDCVFTLLGTGALRWWRVRPLDHVADGAEEVDTTPVVDEGISSQPPAKAGELETGACPEPPKVPPSGSPVGGVGSSPSPTASPTASASPTTTSSPSPSASASPAPQDKGSCEPANPVEKGAWSVGVPFTDTVRPLPDPVPWYQDLTAPDRPMPTPTLSADVCTGNLCRDFPTLSWAEVPGAQAYRVSVARDAAFTNIQAIAETRGLTWTPTDQWRDTTAGSAYHVVVQACTTVPATASLTEGRGPGCDDPSAPVTFRKSSPRLGQVLPANGAAVGGAEVTLSWQAASAVLSAATGAPATSEARAYRVQVAAASGAGFTKSGLVDEALTDSTIWVSADKRYPDGDYVWRVQAVDASGHPQPWSDVRRFTRDGTPPTFTVTSVGRLPLTGGVQVRFSEPVTGVNARSTSLSGELASVVVAPDARTVTLGPGRPLLPGAPHAVTVTSEVRDRAGNPLAGRSVAATADPLVDDRSGAMVLAGAWKRLAATNAVAGTWSRSVPSPARPTSATVLLHGRAAEVRGCVGPANGLLEVLVDGVRVSQVDSYRSYSGCGVVLARTSFSKAGPHRVQVRGTGTRGPRSRGAAVAVDAVTAVR